MAVLETERLILEEHSLANTDALYAILSDHETMRYYPAPCTREDSANWIRSSIASYEKHGFGLWAVFLKEWNHFIGQCGISRQNIDGNVVPEIGYHIHRDHWRRGYATEASSAVLEFGFDGLGLDEIYIHTSVKNAPSWGVAEKLLMNRRCEYDKGIRSHGIIMRHVVYSLTKEEYRRIRGGEGWNPGGKR